MYRTIFNPEEKLWSGVAQPPLYNPKISLGHVLMRAMKSNPDKIAQISAESNTQVTYGELHAKSVRAAQNIQKLNYEKGDVFAVISKNNHELAPVVMALLSTGHPFNTLDPLFTETEMMHMLSLTKPKLVFAELSSYETVKESLRKLGNDAPIYTFGGRAEGARAVEELFTATGLESEFIPVDVDGEKDTAVIVCSSGTTGMPKGVCLTHAGLLDGATRGFEPLADSVWLCFSNLYWVTGVMILLVAILNVNTRIITTETYSPELLLKLIERYKVTDLLNSSHHLVLAAKCNDLPHRDLSSVKNWYVGGSKMPLDTVVQLCKYIPNGAVHVAYGMSELACATAIVYPYKETEAVGQLFSGVKAKIVDEYGTRLGIGQSGEICMKTHYTFGGYYGNQATTDALFDADGFIQTGDIGHFDEEGFLFITDRKKDFLKYCSYMISPTEIESALIACPKVASVCVVGIPDILAGDLPAAVIVRTDNSNVTEEEIHAILAGQFTDNKRLRGGVYFVDSIPTTPSGKVLRRKVRDLVMSRYKKSKLAWKGQ